MKRANLTRALAAAAETVKAHGKGAPTKTLVRERLWADGFDIDMIDLVMAFCDLAVALRDDK